MSPHLRNVKGMALIETVKSSFFVVEDEVLIRMMLVDMIEELNYGVVAEAGSLGEGAAPCARCRVRHCDPGYKPGRRSNSAPIADVIAKRGIPFIYASGYGADGVPEDFKSRSVLREPLHLEELDKVVRSLLTTERLPR